MLNLSSRSLSLVAYATDSAAHNCRASASSTSTGCARQRRRRSARRSASTSATPSRRSSLFQVPARLAALPGVASAAIDPVCCEEGKTMLYVGVAEEGAPALELRAPPDGASRLTAGRDPGRRSRSPSARARDHARLHEGGHLAGPFAHGRFGGADDPAQFIALAAKHLDSLRKVLRTSSDGDHRALAAEVLAYYAEQAERRRRISSTRCAIRSAKCETTRRVRSRSSRCTRQQHPELKITVPYEPFIDLLNSLAWTDRNKASLALMQLTESAESRACSRRSRRARSTPLVDIARWTNPGHSMAGIFMLGRMAGIADPEIYAMFERGERDKIIEAARKANMTAAQLLAAARGLPTAPRCCLLADTLCSPCRAIIARVCQCAERR